MLFTVLLTFITLWINIHHVVNSTNAPQGICWINDVCSGEGGWFFIFFDCSSPFCILLIEFHYTFFPFLIKYYPIMFIIILFRFSSDKPFTCFFAGFLLFFPKGSVTGCDWSLGSFCYSGMILHFAFMHLLSGYYYYDYVIIVLQTLAVKVKLSVESHLLRLIRLNS